MKSISAVGALVLCAALSLGCETMVATARRFPVPGGGGEGITEEELHAEVLGGANRFGAEVSAMAARIGAKRGSSSA